MFRAAARASRGSFAATSSRRWEFVYACTVVSIPLIDAEGFVQHERDRREPVRRARGVRDDVVVPRVVQMVVHAHDDRDVLVLRGRRDDHRRRTGLQVPRRALGVGELARRLQHQVDAVFEPRDRRGARLAVHPDRLAVDHDRAVLCLDGPRVRAVGGIVLEQPGVGRRIDDVVDRDDLGRAAGAPQQRSQREPSDPAKSVDPDPHSHDNTSAEPPRASPARIRHV